MSVALKVMLPGVERGQVPLVDEFQRCVESATGAPLKARAIDTIQVNIGLTCDLACRHCHVESSPKRTEQMDWPTMMLVLRAARRAKAKTLDITGGAPELNPHLRHFITVARCRDLNVIIRTNLTIMLREGFEDFPRFYAENAVHLVASLPCYLPINVDQQRGLHVYEKSIEVIRRLNGVGYGTDQKLPLDLVYNPIGPALPPDQQELEDDYRRELDRRFGIKFTRLIAITNMPIGRFLRDLRRDDQDERYLQVLRESFNPQTVDRLMCRYQVHVSWDGTLHDCDFNYALRMGTMTLRVRHIRDFDPRALIGREIATGPHCFGCTAGHGSSCGGALT